MNATDWLSTLVTKLKGRTYRIDPGISPTYLGLVTLDRIAMRVRGAVRFPLRRDRPFVGRGVSLRAKNLIQCGPNVTLADRSRIDAMSRDGVKLGANTSLGRFSRIECTGNLQYLGAGFTAGANVGLGTDCFYGAAGGIEIGDDTIIGNLVTMHSENHNAEVVDVPIRDQGVRHEGIRIGRGCWLGTKVTVLDGARLGADSIVAAGAVLTAGDYPAGGIYGGVPARLIRMREGYDRVEG